MLDFPPLTDEELAALESLAAQVPGYPWEAYVEGRDMLSGSTFIMTGTDEVGDRGCDLYLHLEPDIPFGQSIRHINHVDFVAELRTVLPTLIADVRASRAGSSARLVSERSLTRIGTLEYVCDSAPWALTAGADPKTTWIESTAEGGSVSRIQVSSYEPLPAAVLTLIVEMRNALPSLIIELGARASPPPRG